MCSPLLLSGDQALKEPGDFCKFPQLNDMRPVESENATYDWDTWLRQHGVELV
tara:strand:- start:225 stop:383 length:159 start_codon:yes stop_codon:yes gene_type:complete